MSLKKRILRFALKKKQKALTTFWRNISKDFPYMLVRNNIAYPLTEQDIDVLEMTENDVIFRTSDLTNNSNLKLHESL